MGVLVVGVGGVLVGIEKERKCRMRKRFSKSRKSHRLMDGREHVCSVNATQGRDVLRAVRDEHRQRSSCPLNRWDTK